MALNLFKRLQRHIIPFGVAKLYRLCCPIASANPLAFTPGSMAPLFGFEEVYQSSSHSIVWGFESWGTVGLSNWELQSWAMIF